MNKREFLDLLRQALEGEVSPNIVEENIKYYDQYISSRSDKDEEAVLKELGHPRLIAKTIIESERIAREKGKTNGYRRYYEDDGNRHYSREAEQERRQEEHRDFRRHRPFIFFRGIRWYHKVIMWAVLIVFFLLLLFIGRVILYLLSVFLLPILLIYSLMTLFRRR